MPRINKNSAYIYKCYCECGGIRIAEARELLRGHYTSCGCMYRKGLYKKGYSKLRIYKIWTDMKDRCYNVKSSAYHNYGKRNISVCEEWLNSFEVFNNWSQNNGYQKHLTLERIDVNGNYEPKNCTWITKSKQSQNTRKSIKVVYNNEEYFLKDLLKELNLLDKYKLISSRIQRNKWDIEKALFTQKLTHNKENNV